MGAWDEATVGNLAPRLRLQLDPRRQRQGIGARIGAGPGASLEFHDYRAYQEGDDPRQIDWGVYARSGELLLRRHRQEISPRLELLFDCSASMGLSAAKATLATQLCALIASCGERDGSRPCLWCCGDAAPQGQGPWRDLLRASTCTGRAGLAARIPGLRAGSERVLISDGLHAAGAQSLVRRLGQGAGSLCLIQVLTRGECDPAALGPSRLIDLEDGGAHDLILDDAACARYRARLARHQAAWQEALAGRGAGLITCLVDEGFPAALQACLAAGLLAMAAV